MMLGKLTATVLFVQDLEKCMKFYEDIFGLGKPYADPVSAAYQIAGHDFVLLKAAAATEMVGEDAVSVTGQRVLLCLEVENVDASYETLTAKGLAFLKPPKSQ